MIVRACLCIPTYNNPETIAAVVADALAQTPFPVLVVDDGSDLPVSEILKKAKISNKRLRLIRHSANLGKGKAIQSAFQDALSINHTHLITMDGDGQHLVSEVPKLVSAMLENPWNMVLGNRRLGGADVPEISKFGRKFSNFWVKYETNQSIADSQSGFRIYPLFHIQNLKFWTSRFDFEIEVLIRLLWKGVHIREVEMECYYPPATERVSHFDKLWDNVRISFLNALLVVLSLLKSNHSPLKGSVAIALGVWIGVLPIYGLHAFFAGLASVFLRLNFVYLFLGTQVSLPPLIPFLLLGSAKMGKIFSTNWVFGSVMLATLLGGFTFALSYIFMTLLKPRKKANWSGKTRGGTLGNGFLKIVLKNISLKAGYFCLFFIIPYFYVFAPRARKAATEYWKMIFPLDQAVRRQFRVLKQLHQFGRVLMDRLFQSFHIENRFELQSNGAQNIVEAVDSGRGVVLLGAHVGGWDLAARTLKTRTNSEQFATVQHEAEGATFTKVKEQTEAERLKLISINAASVGAQPVFHIRDALKQGQPIGFMADRPTGMNYELILFLGKLIPIDTTPFRVAQACNSFVIFTFGFKAKKNQYDFFASKAEDFVNVQSTHQNKQLVIYDWACEFAQNLELYIRQYPEQWFNFFPAWSTVPKPLDGSEIGNSRHVLFEDLKTSSKHKPTTTSISKSV